MNNYTLPKNVNTMINLIMLCDSLKKPKTKKALEKYYNKVDAIFSKLSDLTNVYKEKSIVYLDGASISTVFCPGGHGSMRGEAEIVSNYGTKLVISPLGTHEVYYVHIFELDNFLKIYIQSK